jgi:hypothetical protein
MRGQMRWQVKSRRVISESETHTFAFVFDGTRRRGGCVDPAGVVPEMTSILHPLYFSLFPQGEAVTSRAHGLDISKYDLFFRPENAINQLDFVIQRVSYRLTRDEAFAQLVNGVMSVPIRGGYHYLNSDKGWKEQADKFLSYVAGYDYHFFACDFEGSFNALSLDFAYQAWQWIHYVAGETGKPILLYTSPSLYNSYIAPSQSRFGINWNTVPLWTAQWFFTPNPNGAPSNPAGRTAGWKFWQYTDKGDGTQYGVARPTACDLNVFNGTVQQLRDWLRIGVPAPDPDGGSMAQVIQGEAVGNVTRRKSPQGEPFAPARYLVTGDKIEASENQFQWLKLKKINGVAVVGDEWVSAGATQQYIKWDWVNVTDPAPDPDPDPTITLKHTIKIYSNGGYQVDDGPVVP